MSPVKPLPPKLRVHQPPVSNSPLASIEGPISLPARLEVAGSQSEQEAKDNGGMEFLCSESSLWTSTWGCPSPFLQNHEHAISVISSRAPCNLRPPIILVLPIRQNAKQIGP